MTDEYCAKAQSTVELVLEYIRKQVEQGIGRKQVSNATPWYLLQLLSPSPCLNSCHEFSLQ